MKHILTIILIFSVLSSFSQANDRSDYISKYKHLAIEEMLRTGIPASITLAQGLLESGNGKSTLAIEANNHFGIKCHNDWNGPYIRIDDDKPNEKFRKYDDVKDSYRDHSDFLTSKNRYSSLFNLNRTDYKSWAKGLKNAGYATARDYAHRLIKIIEEEKLYIYDKADKTDYKRIVDAQNPSNKFERRVEMINGKKCIRIEKGDTFYSISKSFDVSIRKLRVFNDMEKSDYLKLGQILFLNRKRRKAARGYDYHLVKEGETMYSISQSYGVKIKRLYYFNRFNKFQEPNVGDRIYMRGKAPIE